MHEYAGGNLALRRVITEMNSARPGAPVVDGPPGRRRLRRRVGRPLRGAAVRRTRLRAQLAAVLRAVAARLDPPCAAPQAVGHGRG